MTIFHFRRTESAFLLLPSVASISEMCEKGDLFQAFLDIFLRYLGERVVESGEKEKWRRKKRSFQSHARLCERADALKALDSVASYLENAHF
jgi:hypothetical protein